ncbi:hypothetical protein GCM10027290_24930 [Micromonospora sonneratiae]
MGVALTLGLFAAGCGPIAERQTPTLRTGYDTLDGTLQVWPARGGLMADAGATAAVTEAVRNWRSPIDDRVHLPSSGILWLGEVDGAPLALVAASVPGEAASWLLQLTRKGTGFEVSRSAQYTDPGYLVYSDVLPVQLPTGRRYLTSTRVQRLVGPENKALTITDGLTAPVEVPTCTAVPLTATLITTESLPNGKSDRLLDLGTAVDSPRYPLVGDDSGSGRRVLEGLDTCTLTAKTGPFGSIPQRRGDREEPNSVPESWPIDRIATRSLGTISLPGEKPGQLDQLTWHTDAGNMSAVIFRPAEGTPVVSVADRLDPLQSYPLAVGDRQLVVLTWKAGSESTLSVPPETPLLVDNAGLAVVPRPATAETVSLATPDKTYYRSIGGKIRD